MKPFVFIVVQYLSNSTELYWRTVKGGWTRRKRLATRIEGYEAAKECQRFAEMKAFNEGMKLGKTAVCEVPSKRERQKNRIGQQ